MRLNWAAAFCIKINKNMEYREDIPCFWSGGIILILENYRKTKPAHVQEVQKQAQRWKWVIKLYPKDMSKV